MAEKKKNTKSASSETSVKDLANDLYAACVHHTEDTALFFQEDFLQLDVIPGRSLDKLNECVSRLSSQGLLKLHMQDGRACWKVIDVADAAKYQDLTQDERIVYSQIESAHTDGTWTKLIRARTNLHDTVTKRCIKSLENKGLIKRFKSSKNSNGICYVLTHLRPSESVTGGAFYQDGEADEDLVHYAMDIAHTYILKMSWEKVKSKDDEKKGKKNISKEDAEAARREGLEGEKRCNKYIPLPPGYQGYPTIPEIAKHLNSRVEFTEKFTEQDIGKVTDLLVWDGRVEKVLGGRAFRAILNASSSESRDEAPCVRCPVFDFCDESGPVNACTCPYFQAWLKF